MIPYTRVKAPEVLATNDRGTLEEQISHILNHDPNLHGSISGISIRSANTGEILYEHNGEIRLRPASNMKILTAAGSLSVLGKDYTFSTEVLSNGKIRGNTLAGDLFLKGKGDPTLLISDFDKMAKDLKESGLKLIVGDLIGDDSWYDDIRYSSDLIWSDEHTYYGAQVSALTASPNEDYDAGTVIVEVSPGRKVNDKASITITPNNEYVSVVNTSKTVEHGENQDITITRDHGNNTIRIEGTIPLKNGYEKDWISVWEPTDYALDLFRHALEEQGIKIAGKVERGMTPSDATLLTSHQSMPLSELLIPFMKLSNNGHAETLIKEMGKKVADEGSWEKGLETLNTELAKYGVNPDTMILRDGSGISHVSLIPANEISKLLYTIQQKDWFDEFLYSLPVAGVKDRMVGGTLRNRMKTELLAGNVQAKTGTISTVSSLSGYVKTKNGKTLIFSILLNNLMDDSKGRAVEDQIVEILANT
ncbi:D-alanyl-D-alanine carboxypeptidase/D-alanyl-D-alanine-endopeptidase [Cytobacillus sp. FJAT-54145]|uniref:D-alanyl-D-alanine carboxypeptidase/D-alanyl-D-alanine-endopeptidase n=1 Tax=Cytobacillus spartinae TaxID=3299023 RepID=A0ABW6K5F9_9BACI